MFYLTESIILYANVFIHVQFLYVSLLSLYDLLDQDVDRCTYAACVSINSCYYYMFKNAFTCNYYVFASSDVQKVIRSRNSTIVRIKVMTSTTIFEHSILAASDTSIFTTGYLDVALT